MDDQLEVELSSPSELAELIRQFESSRDRLLAMLDRRIDRGIASRQGAEDVLQEVYLKARRRWPGFAATKMTAHAWLYRVAMDTLIEVWRKEHREARDPGREMPWPDRSSVQLGLNLIGNGTRPEDAAVRAEIRRRVREAMEGLRPEDREVLAMRHFDELPFREVAMILGITENTAMQRYVRALQRFKALWLTHNSSGGMGR